MPPDGPSTDTIEMIAVKHVASEEEAEPNPAVIAWLKTRVFTRGDDRE
jgi:hypothetical protein